MQSSVRIDSQICIFILTFKLSGCRFCKGRENNPGNETCHDFDNSFMHAKFQTKQFIIAGFIKLWNFYVTDI